MSVQLSMSDFFSDRHTHVSLFLIVFKVIILQSRQYIDAQKNIDCEFCSQYNESFQAVSTRHDQDDEKGCTVYFLTLFFQSIEIRDD